MDLKKEIEKLLNQGKKEDELPKEKPVQGIRISKHMGKYFKATKAYADDRQKKPWNRRKYGRRRRH